MSSPAAVRKSSGESRNQSRRDLHGKRHGRAASPAAGGAAFAARAPALGSRSCRRPPHDLLGGTPEDVEDRLRVEADPERQDDERGERQLLAQRSGPASFALAGFVISPKKTRW